MKKLITILFFAISLNGFSMPKNASLIADETWIAKTEKTVRIITSNAEIVKKLLATDYRSVTRATKKDRKGEYIEYSFSYKADSFTMPKI
jgi:hypothetical protein